MRDIKIFSTDSITGKISINLNNLAEQTYDSEGLLQKVGLSLLNMIGSNMYNLNKGSRIPSILFSAYTPDKIEIIKTAILMAITELEQKLISEQATNINLSNNERLSKLEIMDISYNEAETSWNIKMFVRTASNTLLFLEI